MGFTFFFILHVAFFCPHLNLQPRHSLFPPPFAVAWANALSPSCWRCYICCVVLFSLLSVLPWFPLLFVFVVGGGITLLSSTTRIGSSLVFPPSCHALLLFFYSINLNSPFSPFLVDVYNLVFVSLVATRSLSRRQKYEIPLKNSLQRLQTYNQIFKLH